MMEMLESVDRLVTTASTVLLVLMAVPIGMTLLRMMMGPSHADRFVALDMLTGIAVATAALSAIASGSREYMDVGLGLAVFGFVGTCALAAFLERRAGAKQ